MTLRERDLVGARVRNSVFIEVRSSSYHRRIRASVRSKFDRRRNTEGSPPRDASLPPLPHRRARLGRDVPDRRPRARARRRLPHDDDPLRARLARSSWHCSAAVEGRRALRHRDGRALELWLLGTVGFAGFNLLTYVALEHTRPQDAALIVATAPVITVLVALGDSAAAARAARSSRSPRSPSPGSRS